MLGKDDMVIEQDHDLQIKTYSGTNENGITP